MRCAPPERRHGTSAAHDLVVGRRWRTPALVMRSMSRTTPRSSRKTLRSALSCSWSGSCVAVRWQNTVKRRSALLDRGGMCVSVWRCSMLRLCAASTLVRLARRPGLSGPVRRTWAAYGRGSPESRESSWAWMLIPLKAANWEGLSWRLSSASFSGAQSTCMVTAKSPPSLTILEVVRFPSHSRMRLVSSATMPGRSGPRTETITWDLDASSTGGGLAMVRWKSSMDWLSGRGPMGSVVGTTSSPPRMAERMQVHTREVEATQGMRSHMGMKAKLRNVDGTHTFQRAIMSSCMLPTYFSMAFLGSGCGEVTASLIM
mmetsp:Transcript_20464/g.68712  ORF Transcript_20464/g.68712 Transcript_20464/m.68712 type:complete len:316 (+) Transcript_20464:307-1254(+)